MDDNLTGLSDIMLMTVSKHLDILKRLHKRIEALEGKQEVSPITQQIRDFLEEKDSEQEVKKEVGESELIGILNYHSPMLGLIGEDYTQVTKEIHQLAIKKVDDVYKGIAIYWEEGERLKQIKKALGDM